MRTKPKILIIDDDEAILNLYQDALSSDYDVTAIVDWLEAANFVLSGAYDLLILDLGMSVFDPVQFIEKIRADGVTAPILISSAYSDLRERVAGAGVDATLAKPFTIHELERIVAQLINRESIRQVK